MDDISLYIDYIIVSSFCTPVSSFSLPLHLFLSILFTLHDILSVHNQKGVSNYEYHLVKIYTGSKNLIVFPQVTVSRYVCRTVSDTI